MKSFLAKIFTLGLFITAICIVFLQAPRSASAADCTVTSAKISPGSNVSIPDFYNHENPPMVTLAVSFANCAGEAINIDLISSIPTPDKAIPEWSARAFNLTLDQAQLLLTFKAGTTLCSYTCDYYFRITTPRTSYSTEGKTDGELKYENPNIDAPDEWERISITQGTGLFTRPQAGDCSVTSATFNPFTNEGEYSKTFYADDTHPPVTLTFKTKNCGGKKIFVSLVEGIQHAANPLTIPVLSNKEYLIPTSNELTITLGAGEDECYQIGHPHCGYYIIAGPQQYSLYNLTFHEEIYYYSKGKTNGLLAYDCDGLTCLDDWQYISDTANVDDPNEVTVTNNEGGFSTGIDPQSSCYDKTSGKMIDGCYSVFSGFAQALGKKFDKISSTDSLGGWLNAIIAFATAIGGVIAVVMIMYEGFQYMAQRKEGNPAKMADTSGRIFQTILGLLLLLCIYVLLRTINPDLLNLTPRMGEIAIVSDSDYRQATGKSPKPKNQAIQEAIDRANQTGTVDACVIDTLIEKESRSNTTAIGHDENVPRADIPSRQTFISSGKKSSGASFSGSITDRRSVNDDGRISPSLETLGLDTRFSHGIGLFQITVFPGNGSEYARTINGVAYSPKKLLDVDNNTQATFDLFSENLATCGNIQDAFRMWNGGKCEAGRSTDSANNYSESAFNLYDKCKNKPA